MNFVAEFVADFLACPGSSRPNLAPWCSTVALSVGGAGPAAATGRSLSPVDAPDADRGATC